MHTTRAGQPRFIGGIQNAAGFVEQVLGVINSQELQEALGADTYPTPEQPLEMIGAHVDVSGHLLQTGLILEVLLQVLDGFFDLCVIS